MVSLGVEALLGLLAVAGLGAGVGGFWFRRKREEAHRRAHEASFREQVNAAGRARDRARDEAQEADERLLRMREEHSGCSARIAELKAACANHVAVAVSLRSELHGRDARLSTLEAQVAAAAAELAELSARLGKKTQIEAELAEARDARAAGERRETRLEARLEELEARLEVSESQRRDGAPNWLLSGPKGRKDDLKAIRGLGPVLERDLNKLGIFHFHQLARMTTKDVHWIAGRIHAFSGLNKRYRWADQARMRRSRPNGANGDLRKKRT